MQVEAGRAGVLTLLTDHDNFHEISVIVIESARLQGGDGDKIRRRLIVETCVLLLCFTAVVVEDIQEFSDGRILATMIPEASDFNYGMTEWRVNPTRTDHSEINYRSVLQPDFWIPPVIGPFLLKRKLVKEAQDTILNIERLANVSGQKFPVPGGVKDSLSADQD